MVKQHNLIQRLSEAFSNGKTTNASKAQSLSLSEGFQSTQQINNPPSNFNLHKQQRGKQLRVEEQFKPPKKRV